MPPNKLPLEFLDLNDMGTQSRGVSVLYGRRADGTLVAVNVANDGSLAISTSIAASDIEIGAVELKDATTDDRVNIKVVGGLPNAVVTSPNGSTNSFFQDQTSLALTAAFQNIPFGFTSFSIYLSNDDGVESIEYSFDGVNIHGRLLVGEGIVQDFRAQAGAWLRTASGNPANYRVSSY